jgi:hypothetical protein
MLPSAISPKLSAETTLFTFIAAFCSAMALALPSRSVETTNLSRRTTWSPWRSVEPMAVISKSRTAVSPAVTVNFSVRVL